MLLKKMLIILMLIGVAIICIITFPFSGFAAAANYNLLADTGLTLLEQILLVTGVSSGGLAFILIRIARQGVKEMLKSLDDNPYIDNKDLLKHAKYTGDKKVEKLFQEINSP